MPCDRPIINQTGTAANFKVKTRGVVADATGQEWTMQSFIKVRDIAGREQPHVLNEGMTRKAL